MASSPAPVEGKWRRPIVPERQFTVNPGKKKENEVFVCIKETGDERDGRSAHATCLFLFGFFFFAIFSLAAADGES